MILTDSSEHMALPYKSCGRQATGPRYQVHTNLDVGSCSFRNITSALNFYVLFMSLSKYPNEM
jgi:hypothetical protein